MALNILIVDDSAVMRSMIARTLGLTGVDIGEVLHASNGQEGLDVLKENWVDVALVDLNMPVMNGEEMIQAIREAPDMVDLPVVVVSSEGSETRIERIVSKGARFIHKPFQPELVRDILLEITGAIDEHES